MTPQQLRCLCQVVDSDFSVSRAAQRLHTTQPGVTKMIRALEEATGCALFVRARNRLVGLTEAGQLALSLAHRALNDMRAISRIGANLQDAATGVLRLGTTHFHARYPLLSILPDFVRQYPGIRLELMQGNPLQIFQWLDEGRIDIGICGAPVQVPDSLMTLHAYTVERCVIVPKGHALARKRRITMADLAEYPLITYDNSFSTGRVLESAFAQHGLSPQISMRATDVNVAKAYVAAGLGISLIPRPAVEAQVDSGLKIMECAPAFPPSVAVIALRKRQLLRSYATRLISMINPELAPDLVVSKVFGAS